MEQHDWERGEVFAPTKTEIDHHASAFGNYFIEITPEQWRQMQQGMIFCHRDEYGFFIRLVTKQE